VGVVVLSGCLYNCCNSIVGTCISMGVCLYLQADACDSVDDHSCACVLFITLEYYYIGQAFVVVSLRAQPPGLSPEFGLNLVGLY